MRPLLAALLLMAGTALAELPDRLDRPATEKGFVTIHYPEDFDLERAYHVLYWFHGTGGSPNPGIATAHPDYIGVGMSYFDQNSSPALEYGGKLWKECLDVRDLLEGLGLNLRRNVVAGMSKGGWCAYYVGVGAPSGPDAIAIFAAGKDRAEGDLENADSSLSVLVGTGETDGNYPYAQNAISYFRKAGVALCYEEWLGKGHTYQASERVVDWMAVEALMDRPAELHKHASETVQKGFAEAKAEVDSLNRYLLLRHLLGHPAIAHAPGELRERILAAGRDASTDPTVVAWQVDQKKLRTLVTCEASFFSELRFDVPLIEKLVEHFRILAETAADPAIRARAAYGARRAHKMFVMYREQEKAFQDPEYLALKKRFAELEKIYNDARGQVDIIVMSEINEVREKIKDFRFKASMTPFRKVERAQPEADALLDPIFDADPEDRPRPYSGLAF